MVAEIRGKGGDFAVNLRAKVVEEGDGVALGEEFAGEVGSDEAGTSGDEGSVAQMGS